LNSKITCGIRAALCIAAGAAPSLAASAPPREGAAGTLEEVVVTATKRSETLIEVPAMVSVLTAEDIQAAGIARSADFLNSTPNVTFQEDNTGETFINIRGQTSTRNSDPNVAIVVDGVTLTSIRSFNQDLYDLQQIEVLKGPQSAIYGRNAAAGAIVITTKRPSEEFEGSVTAAVGNFGTTRFGGSVSGPISDAWSYRAAMSFRDTEGPFTNSTTGEKVMRTTPTLGRVRFLYEPDDRLSVDIKLGMSQTRGGTLAYQAQFVGLPIGNYPGTELDANFARVTRRERLELPARAQHAEERADPSRLDVATEQREPHRVADDGADRAQREARQRDRRARVRTHGGERPVRRERQPREHDHGEHQLGRLGRAAHRRVE